MKPLPQSKLGFKVRSLFLRVLFLEKLIERAGIFLRESSGLGGFVQGLDERGDRGADAGRFRHLEAEARVLAEKFDAERRLVEFARHDPAGGFLKELAYRRPRRSPQSRRKTSSGPPRASPATAMTSALTPVDDRKHELVKELEDVAGSVIADANGRSREGKENRPHPLQGLLRAPDRQEPVPRGARPAEDRRVQVNGRLSRPASRAPSAGRLRTHRTRIHDDMVRGVSPGGQGFDDFEHLLPPPGGREGSPWPLPGLRRGSREESPHARRHSSAPRGKGSKAATG